MEEKRKKILFEFPERKEEFEKLDFKAKYFIYTFWQKDLNKRFSHVY